MATRCQTCKPQSRRSARLWQTLSGRNWKHIKMAAIIQTLFNVQGWSGHNQLVPRLEDEVGDAKVPGRHREGVGLPDGGELEPEV